MCVLKRYHVWLFILRKWGFGITPKQCGIHSNLSFNAENLTFIISGTLTCVCMPVYVYACLFISTHA